MRVASVEAYGDAPRAASRRAPCLFLLLGLLFSASVYANPSAIYQESYEYELIYRPADALSALGKLAEVEKRNYEYHFRRGRLLQQLGQLHEAINAYAVASQLEPGSLEALAVISLLQLQLSRWVDAEATTQALLKLDPMNATGRARMAWIAYNLGRFEEAVGRYEGYLVSYPSDAEMRLGLGWALLRLGKKAEAKAVFEQILHVAPGHTTAKQGRAFCE
ncbi:tetratricopeptide repeat protein [Myxococcota bacterium]|nr:tetratricopeptide repeat protein [Myxococcota bacterium]